MPLSYSQNTDERYEKLRQDQPPIVLNIFNRIHEFGDMIRDSADHVYLGISDDLKCVTLKSTHLDASVTLRIPSMEIQLVIHISVPHHPRIELEYTTPIEEFIHVCIDQLMLCIASNYHPIKIQHLQEFIWQYNNMQSPAEHKRARHCVSYT